jgi:hypothetical protein
MRAYLLGVLTVIALGTLLIAYGLLAPQVSAAATAVPAPQAGYVQASTPYAIRTVYEEPRAVPVVVRAAKAPRTTHIASRTSSARDWTKTLLVVGGSTAAGAGIGGIVGGGKGAAIGAAIGGGASTLVEALRR